MTGLPAVSGADMLRALGREGFEIDRVRGSHHVLQHPDGRWTSVLLHRRDLGIGLLRKILRDAEITPDEFLALLRK